MGVFDHFPYTNIHELNLAWIMKQLLELKTTVEQFVSINALKYADPIQWNITSQYEKNTIVIDPITGTAYISVQAVPAGIALTRIDYWSVVFNLGGFVVRAAQNFTDRYEEETTSTATFPTNEGEWLVWGDVLYVALTNIIAGDTYVVDSNIRHFTIEELYNATIQLISDNYDAIIDMIGDLDNLTTTDKSNIVSAINELVTIIGDLGDLTTTDQSSIVNAINELVAEISLDTPFVNVMKFGAVGDGVTNDYAAFDNALNYCKSNGLKLFVPKKSFNLSQYIFTDEQYIFSDSGIYTNGKLIYSKSLAKGSFKKISTQKLYTDTVFGNSAIELQTIVWNELKQCFTIFGWDMSNGPGSIATITDVDEDGTVLATTTKPYGLINDAFYFADNNSIIVTGSSIGDYDWNGKIVELNANTYAVVNTYDCGVNTAFEIGYDSTNEIIYVCGRKVPTVWHMAILDKNFNIVKQYATADIVIPPYTDSGNNFNYEGSCIINDQFVMQSFNKGHFILSTYNLEDASVKDYIVEPIKEAFTVESAYTKGNFLYIAGYQSNMIIIDKYDLETLTTNSDYITDCIRELPSVVDLDTLGLDTVYVYQGVYSNVSNMPNGVKASGAFVIRTTRLGAVHQYQILMTEIGQIFLRNTNNIYKAWTNWKQIAGAGNITLVKTYFHTGFIAANGLSVVVTIPLPYITRAYKVTAVSVTSLSVWFQGTENVIADGDVTVTVLAKEDSAVSIRIAYPTAITPNFEYEPCLVRMITTISIGDV